MIKNRITKTKILEIKQTASAIMEKKAEFDSNMQSFKESVQAIKLKKDKLNEMILSSKEIGKSNKVKKIARQKIKAKAQKF